MGAGHGTAAESAAALARPQLGIDPVALEELANDGAGPGAERGMTLLDGAPSGRPITGLLLGEKRSIAVVIEQRLQAEQTALEAVVALDGRMVSLRRRHQ